MEFGVKFVTGITLVLFFYNNCAEVNSHPYEWTRSRPHLTLFEHENHQGKAYHQDVGPRCYNLPKVFDAQASSLNTHHQCVKVCVRRDCRKCIKMGPGSPGHFALKEIGFNDAISSFTQC